MKVILKGSIGLLLAVVLTALTSCAAVKPIDRGRISTVAIVTLLEEQTNVMGAGLRVFKNTPRKIDHAGKFNEVAYNAVAERLRATAPEWRIVRVEYDRADLIKKRDQGGFIRPPPLESIAAELAASVKASGVDMILVVNHQRHSVGNWTHPHFKGSTLLLNTEIMDAPTGMILFANAWVGVALTDGPTRGARVSSEVTHKSYSPQDLGFEFFMLDDKAKDRVQARVRGLAQQQLREVIGAAMTDLLP